MSWHCLPGSAADCSLPDYLRGIRSQRLKSNRSAGRDYLTVSGMESWSRSLSGMTFAPLTAGNSTGLWTWLREAFPVRTFLMPGRGKVSLPVNVRDYGENTFGSLARLNLFLCSPKMPRSYDVSAWESSFATYTHWGIMLDGVAWELGTCLGITPANVSGFWHTPQKFDALSHESMLCPKKWRERAVRRLAEGYKLQPRLSVQVQVEGTPLHPLNPNWLEWLMGWPIKWTASKPLEMAKFQQWLQQHSEFYRTVSPTKEHP